MFSMCTFIKCSFTFILLCINFATDRDAVALICFHTKAQSMKRSKQLTKKQKKCRVYYFSFGNLVIQFRFSIGFYWVLLILQPFQIRRQFFKTKFQALFTHRQLSILICGLWASGKLIGPKYAVILARFVPRRTLTFLH